MSLIYQGGLKAIMDGTDNFIAGDVQILLLTSGYVVNPDDEFVADLTPGSNELSGPGYSRQSLSGKTVTKDDTNNRAVFDANDITWVGLNAGTAAQAILFFQKTNDADSILIAQIDTGGFPIVSSGGDVVISWNTDGILAL